MVTFSHFALALFVYLQLYFNVLYVLFFFMQLGPVQEQYFCTFDYMKDMTLICH